MARTGFFPTALLVGACLAIVAGLAALVLAQSTTAFDRAVTDVVRATELRDPLGWLRVVTEAGSTWAVTLLAGVTVAVGLAVGPWRHAVIGAAVILLSSAANTVVKAVVARSRPDVLDAIVTESGYSFPSGHSALGMVGWGILAVLVWRTRLPRPARVGLVAAMAMLVALIGISRVYLGVHYPTDVIAGWAAGAVIVLLYERFTRTVSREPAAAAVDADRAAPRSDPPATG